MTTYANFFTYDTIQSIFPGAMVPLNMENVPPIGISSEGQEQFRVFEPGVYFITYGVHYAATTITLPVTTSIAINGIENMAFTVRSGNEIDGWNTSSGLVQLFGGELVSIMNAGPNPFDLGYGLPGAEAYLNFLRIAQL